MKKKTIALFLVVLVFLLSVVAFADFNYRPDETYFKWPTSSTRITDTFGTYRDHGYHKGIDIGAIQSGVSGDRVSAIQYGKVMFSGKKSYANVVAINHNSSLNGFTDSCLQSVYTHGSNLQVHAGETVYRGQKVCDMDGTFGYAVHLHFEIREIDSYNQSYVWSGGVPVDPLAFYSRFTPTSVTTDISNSSVEKVKVNDDKSDEYSHSYGIIKGDRLFTVEYLLNMTSAELESANISKEELLSLSNELKSFDSKLSKKVMKIIQ